MLHAICLEFFYIWFDIRTLITRDIDIAKKTLLPGVLRRIPNIESGDIATRFEVGTIELCTGTMIVKILRIL